MIVLFTIIILLRKNGNFFLNDTAVSKEIQPVVQYIVVIPSLTKLIEILLLMSVDFGLSSTKFQADFLFDAIFTLMFY